MPYAVGEWIRITGSCEAFEGFVVRITGLPRPKLKGYDGELDLGQLVQFSRTDAQNRISHYILPAEWVEPAESPTVAPARAVLKPGRKPGRVRERERLDSERARR